MQGFLALLASKMWLCQFLFGCKALPFAVEYPMSSLMMDTVQSTPDGPPLLFSCCASIKGFFVFLRHFSEVVEHWFKLHRAFSTTPSKGHEDFSGVAESLYASKVDEHEGVLVKPAG